MIKTHVKASSEYDVITGSGVLDSIGELITKRDNKITKVLVVSDTNVAPLYLEKVKNSIKASGLEVFDYIFEAGEQSKNINTITDMWNKMASSGFTRTDLLVALGGGVAGDMGGFAASSFLRGIKVCQIPTSLLAMVDASVGGKTGIDIPAGKNQVGAFWQPMLVLEDTDCLKTLPDETFTEGMAEVIKYAYIMDTNLYDLLLEKKNEGIRIRDNATLMEQIVGMCVKDKVDVIESDEFDNGRRQTLNYGHTAGHVIERNSNFSLPHGVCVAKGMGIFIDCCKAKGTLDSEEAIKMKDLIKAYGLPVDDEITPEDIVAGAMNDKKKRGNVISVILVNKIGTSDIVKMTPDEFLTFLKKESK